MTKEEAIKILRHWGSNTPAINRDCAVKMAIEALENPEPHWIPVTERLPKDGQYILAYYPEFECGCLVQKYRTIGNYGFVAWMPLHEPFKGVTDGRD